jgi:hypothetical protein
MNTSPSGGEDLHVVRRDKPPPRLWQSAGPDPDQENSANLVLGESSRRWSIGWLTFAGSLILVTLAFCAGFSYLLEHRWPGYAGKQLQRDVADTTPLDSSGVVAKPGSEMLNADMLHVTAIALGNPRRASVNGKSVAEGESLTVTTSSGSTTVRVTKISDRIVRFAHDGKIIEAKLVETEAPNAPP